MVRSDPNTRVGIDPKSWIARWGFPGTILVLFSYACLAAIADMRQIASTFLAQAKEDRAADRAMIFQLASTVEQNTRATDRMAHSMSTMTMIIDRLDRKHSVELIWPQGMEFATPEKLPMPHEKGS